MRSATKVEDSFVLEETRVPFGDTLRSHRKQTRHFGVSEASVCYAGPTHPSVHARSAPHEPRAAAVLDPRQQTPTPRPPAAISRQGDRGLRRSAALSLFVAALGLVVGACGSDSPAAPAGPTYPNIIGAWTGTATIAVVGVSVSGTVTNICSTTWIINQQTDANFSGTFQLSGGTVAACGQSGSFTGMITPTGSITVNWNSFTVVSGSSCTYVSGSAVLVGVITGNSWTTQETIRESCPGLVADQTVTLALSKR